MRKYFIAIATILLGQVALAGGNPKEIDLPSESPIDEFDTAMKNAEGTSGPVIMSPASGADLSRARKVRESQLQAKNARIAPAVKSQDIRKGSLATRIIKKKTPITAATKAPLQAEFRDTKTAPSVGRTLPDQYLESPKRSVEPVLTVAKNDSATSMPDRYAVVPASASGVTKGKLAGNSDPNDSIAIVDTREMLEERISVEFQQGGTIKEILQSIMPKQWRVVTNFDRKRRHLETQKFAFAATASRQQCLSGLLEEIRRTDPIDFMPMADMTDASGNKSPAMYVVINKYRN